MAVAEKRLIFKHIDQSDYTIDINCYLKHGGYETAKKAFALGKGRGFVVY